MNSYLIGNGNGSMKLAALVDAVPAKRLTAPIGYRTSIFTSPFTLGNFEAEINSICRLKEPQDFHIYIH